MTLTQLKQDMIRHYGLVVRAVPHCVPAPRPRHGMKDACHTGMMGMVSPHVHVPIRGEAMTVVVDGEGPGKRGGEDARRVGTL